MTVEPGKTYVIEAVDTQRRSHGERDRDARRLGAETALGAAGSEVDCAAANGPRPPAVEWQRWHSVRVRTALPKAGMQQNKRPVYVKVTRMDPSLGGGAQFKIRAREATIYGRWLTNGYDYHVEVENTTGDAMCVEVARYPASGLTYAAGPGWSGAIASFTLTVPPFGAVKQVIASGSLVGADSEGALRISACGSPVNLIPGALHVSTLPSTRWPIGSSISSPRRRTRARRGARGSGIDGSAAGCNSAARMKELDRYLERTES